MRIIIETESSQSPGVNVIGSRDDLIALTEALRNELGKSRADDSPSSNFISIPDLHCESANYEWLGFQICNDLDARLRAESKKKKFGCVVAIVLALVGIAILYLAYRGASTL
jgi:hypothetical protein